MEESIFGKPLCLSEFLLSKEHIQVNHGSYGTVPKIVQEERLRLMCEVECTPDKWYRWTLENYIKDNLAAAAEFLKSDPRNLVFVSNATTGCNCVLKSVPLQRGDALLINCYTYGGVKYTAQTAAEKWGKVVAVLGAEVLNLQIPLEIKSKAEIVNLYSDFLNEHKNVKLLVLDYISSSSALLYPVKEIAKLCKHFGVLLLIDGAHSPGQVQVDLEEFGKLGVDFYVGDFHKWTFTPRGCAVLWCHPKHHHIIRPVVTSNNQTADFKDSFFAIDTTDPTPFLCVKKALEFYNSLGGLDVIHDYSCNLLEKAATMLCEAWDTEMLPVTKDMVAPYMRVIRLPDNMNFPVPIPEKHSAFSDMLPMMRYLNENYQISTFIFGIQGKPWIRISSTVCNSMEDYERLRDVIIQMQLLL